MTQQVHDSDDIRALAAALSELVDYTARLQTQAEGAAFALAHTWKGGASAEFLQTVSIWAVSSSALRQGAEQLSVWANSAAAAYDAAQEQTQQLWQGS